jgi:hypothetical protein
MKRRKVTNCNKCTWSYYCKYHTEEYKKPFKSKTIKIRSRKLYNYFCLAAEHKDISGLFISLSNFGLDLIKENQ